MNQETAALLLCVGLMMGVSGVSWSSVMFIKWAYVALGKDIFYAAGFSIVGLGLGLLGFRNLK